MNTSTHILLAYATKHGSTQEVTEAIAETLGASGHEVDVCAAADVSVLHGYDGVILGGSLTWAAGMATPSASSSAIVMRSRRSRSRSSPWAHGRSRTPM